MLYSPKMTSGVRYLGSKTKIIPHIQEVLSKLLAPNKTIIDVFTGTTRVAQSLRQTEWKVITSDLSWASETYSNTFIGSKNNKHLQKYLDELNGLEGEEDWITKSYCDVIANGNIVRVWKRHNGMKADAIRNKIETYTHLERWEKDTLITSLIFALDKVDNTIGIQQAYLKDWMSKRADNNIFLLLPEIPEGQTGTHIQGDALKIDYPEADIAYLDPPYTPADYSTYYHIWDSIARWDKPEVSMKTNRRVDRCKSGTQRDEKMMSPWYSKKTAFQATKTLVNKLPVKYVIFSYSNDGIISLDEMKSIPGLIEVKEIQHQRNVMKSIGQGANPNADRKNIEYLLVYVKYR